MISSAASRILGNDNRSQHNGKINGKTAMLSFSNGVTSSVIAFIDRVDGGETGPWDATSLSSAQTLLVFPSEGSETLLRDREGTGYGVAVHTRLTYPVHLLPTGGSRSGNAQGWSAWFIGAFNSLPSEQHVRGGGAKPREQAHLLPQAAGTDTRLCQSEQRRSATRRDTQNDGMRLRVLLIFNKGAKYV